MRALSDALHVAPLRQSFTAAIATISKLRGRLIVTGMGKSGLVARKIAATITSTGTPALFLHPGDASHGDLGTIGHDDIVLALSWSGETTELGDIIAYCRRVGVKLIVATAHARLALFSDEALWRRAAALPSLKLRTGAYGRIVRDEGGLRLLDWDRRP